MKIGNLSKLAGVSRDTVRLYEKLGLLKEISRPYEFNNYKDYGEENVDRIRMVNKFQGIGMTLRECKEIIDSIDKGEFDEKSGQKLLQSRIQQINSRISELENTRKVLMGKLGQCPSKAIPFRKKTSQ